MPGVVLIAPAARFKVRGPALTRPGAGIVGEIAS
jgi:hypothetical protein